MRNLLSDRKVQIGLGAAVVLGALWLLLAGGDKVEEANTTEQVTSEVVAPSNVNEAVKAEANSLTETTEEKSENTAENVTDGNTTK